MAKHKISISKELGYIAMVSMLLEPFWVRNQNSLLVIFGALVACAAAAIIMYAAIIAAIPGALVGLGIAIALLVLSIGGKAANDISEDVSMRACFKEETIENATAQVNTWSL